MAPWLHALCCNISKGLLEPLIQSFPLHLMPFRFNARNVFLTYPQCWVPFDDFLDKLLSLPLPDNVTLLNHTVALELHEDGNPHFHAVLSYSTKYSTRNERAWDITYWGETFHPNVQACRSVQKSVEYCLKDPVSSVSTHPTKSSPWADAIAAPTRDEFFAAAERASARDYVLQYRNLEHYADVRYAPAPEPYVPNPNFVFNNLPAPITDWLGVEFTVCFLTSDGVELTFSPSRDGVPLTRNPNLTSHICSYLVYS